MFRILYHPSSGSRELFLTEITRYGSQIFLSCAWSVFGSVILNLWFTGLTVNKHHRFKITLTKTDQAHDKNICESP